MVNTPVLGLGKVNFVLECDVFIHSKSRVEGAFNWIKEYTRPWVVDRYGCGHYVLLDIGTLRK